MAKLIVTISQWRKLGILKSVMGQVSIQRIITSKLCYRYSI